jgi:hypothetical protein
MMISRQKPYIEQIKLTLFKCLVSFGSTCFRNILVFLQINLPSIYTTLCVSRTEKHKMWKATDIQNRSSWQFEWSIEFGRFTVAILNKLIAVQCLSYRWLKICLFCRILFPFLLFYILHLLDLDHYPGYVGGRHMWSRNCLHFDSMRVHPDSPCRLLLFSFVSLYICVLFLLSRLYWWQIYLQKN